MIASVFCPQRRFLLPAFPAIAAYNLAGALHLSRSPNVGTALAASMAGRVSTLKAKVALEAVVGEGSLSQFAEAGVSDTCER